VFWDPRTVRKLWLGAWSETMDGYLRSSAFLELMQHGLRTMADSRAAHSAVRGPSGGPAEPLEDRPSAREANATPTPHFAQGDSNR